MDDLTRIKKKIKGCKRYKALHQVFTTSSLFKVTVDEYRSEIRNLFKTRRFRALSTTSTNFDRDFQAAIIQDQSYRSRMVEITAEVGRARRALDNHIEKFIEYAAVTFASDLKAVGAAKERERFLNSIARRYVDYGAELQNLAEEIDFYVKDIDKAGYAAKNLVEVLSILYHRDGSLPSVNKRS